MLSCFSIFKDVLLPLSLGAISFLSFHFIIEDILEFRKLKKKIQEELIFGSNIWIINDDYEKQKTLSHRDAVRRFSAQLGAINSSLTKISRQYFKHCNIDLMSASRGLMMYQNDILDQDGVRTKGRYETEKALNLPMTKTEDEVQSIMKTAALKNHTR